MRIVGGKFRGRQIASPSGNKTRPMTDEMREAVFNILGPIDGAVVLDAYAGSGAIGLEALSRGAAHVDAIEKSRDAARIIRQNVGSLGADNLYQLYEQPVSAVTKSALASKKYDLIFADPPFSSLNVDVLEQLSKYLTPGGLLILKTPGSTDSPSVSTLKLVDARKYGGSMICFYKRKDESLS